MHPHEANNPSFSSSLLDEIYRSICEGDSQHDDLKFYRDTLPKKHDKDLFAKTCRGVKQPDEVMSSIRRRACLIDKWMEQEFSQRVTTKKQNLTPFDRKLRRDRDLDQDVLFFSSTSSSSDSSSGGFSSSDAESIYGARSKGCSFAPLKPKPVRTTRSGKTERTLFYEQSELHMFDDYGYNSGADHTPRIEDSIIKSKSRALKIYNNLKKVKQPISPGGKLANFINSIFTTANTKKSKSSVSSVSNFDDERKFKSVQASSTCSSASSFSRSCLSKNSPSTREKLRNGVKRSVRFYPISVIVDEDCRPCGHKSLYEAQHEQESTTMSVSLPTAWKIGKSPSRKVDDKSRRVEEVAREIIMKNYHQNQKKNSNNRFEDEGEDEDDAASCSSSDLFELDHLSVTGKEKYREELPVYETTHVGTNRAIASGLIM